MGVRRKEKDIQQKTLNQQQFAKDPTASGPGEKITFAGGSAAKTMKPDRGKGLRKPPSRHPHRRHAFVRTKRAR